MHTQQTLTQHTKTFQHSQQITYYGELIEWIKEQIFNVVISNTSWTELTWKAFSSYIDPQQKHCTLESEWCILELSDGTNAIIKEIKFSLQEVFFDTDKNTYCIVSNEVLYARDFTHNSGDYHFLWRNRKLTLHIDDGLSTQERSEMNRLISLWMTSHPSVQKLKDKIRQHYLSEKEKIQIWINEQKWFDSEITLF